MPGSKVTNQHVVSSKAGKMADYHKLDAKKLQTLKDIANKIRIHSIKSTTSCNSGHPTSSTSIAEILSVLFFHTMKYRIEKPRDPNSDRFVLSKGHACPGLYAAWVEAGLIAPQEFYDKLRRIDNDWEGHPTPRLSFIDVATGSLGQGLSCACGMAYVGKYYDKSSFRNYCIIGDGESAEGSIWEAFSFASNYKLDNLVCIIDVNRLGQSEPTMYQHDVDLYQRRVEAFGWNTYIIDGHDVEALSKAFHLASTVKEKPTCIIAKTFKGRGISGVEDLEGFHGKPLGAKTDAALAEISALIVNNGPHGLTPQGPANDVPNISIKNIKLSSPPNYTLGEKIPVREAYGNALVSLSKGNPRVIAMDGDTKNSTFSGKLNDHDSSKYIECFIAEQNMVGVAVGCATRDRTVVFCSTFAAFMSRAYDQIRMAAISQTNVNFVGTHCGISIGEDGPSQMALEDLAMFRAIPGCTVFYPSDPVSCERAIELAANTKGMTFTRVSRPADPVIYGNDEVFEVGKAKIIRQSEKDVVTLIGCAVTLTECLKAHDELAKSGIYSCVIDPFTIKPLDTATIIAAARATGGHIITVEDHYPEGGLGEAVMSAVAECRDVIVRKLAVQAVPRSGKSAELLEMFGINASCIVKAVKEIIKV